MNVAQSQTRIVAATATNRAHLSRLVKAGSAARIAPGLFLVGSFDAAEEAVRRHLYEVIALTWPGGVLCGRTALAGGVPVGGVIFVAHPGPSRRSRLDLPGVTVAPVAGPGCLAGDMPLLESGLAISGQARRLVENVVVRGRPAGHQAGTVAVEHDIDNLARSGGPGRIRGTLAQLDLIAPHFAPAAVELVRGRLASVLGSFSVGQQPASDRLRARLSGTPYDHRRLELLRGLVVYLADQPPQPPIVPAATLPQAWLPFFEAYFSNFIEGTEFGVDEARRIAVDGEIPEHRPADAHDVAATYRLVTDPVARSGGSATASELLDTLRRHHSVLMAARPDKRPGHFKHVDNYAGGYRFVEAPLVEGTLAHGFHVIHQLPDPLARAVAMMVLVTECHPFLDGNGRIARLLANAELSRAGQVRIVIPTSYRNNYLAALSALSHGYGNGESLLAVLAFAQRWTAAIDWSDYDIALRTLEACNAFIDPGIAETTGRRLRMPGTASAGGSSIRPAQ